MGAASRMISGQITRQITRCRTSIRDVWDLMSARIPAVFRPELRPELSQLSLQFGDLGSDGGNNVLPGLAAAFLGGARRFVPRAGRGAL